MRRKFIVNILIQMKFSFRVCFRLKQGVVPKTVRIVRNRRITTQALKNRPCCKLKTLSPKPKSPKSAAQAVFAWARHGVAHISATWTSSPKSLPQSRLWAWKPVARLACSKTTWPSNYRPLVWTITTTILTPLPTNTPTSFPPASLTTA